MTTEEEKEEKMEELESLSEEAVESEPEPTPEEPAEPYKEPFPDWWWLVGGAVSIVVSVLIFWLVREAALSAPARPPGPPGEMPPAVQTMQAQVTPYVTPTPEGPYRGITITVGTVIEPRVSIPAEALGRQWQKKAGGGVEVVELAEDKLLEQIKSGSDFDVIVYPAHWLAEVKDVVVPISDELKEKVDWEDIAPLYRERVLAWNGTAYAIPYIGASPILAYRKGVLKDEENKEKFKEKYGYDLRPPQTWEEYRDVAEFFQDWDWDGDEDPEYGTLEMQAKGQARWAFLGRAASYADPDEPFFFDADTMEPRINNPGWVKALEQCVEISKLGPPNMAEYSLDQVRGSALMGKAMLAVEWADIGAISLNPRVSAVVGKLGFSALPGAKEVYNPTSGEWEEQPEVRHVPYAAFGGWVQSVLQSSQNQEAAFDFCLFLSSKEVDTLLSMAGVQTMRLSGLDDAEKWSSMGLDAESGYLELVKGIVNDPRAIMDLRIPGAEEYFEALETQLARAIAGEVEPQEALDEAAQAWEEITDRLGREEQKKLYQESLLTGEQE